MKSTLAAAELRRTPLNTTHRAAGARMAGFGGWDMPVEYTGIIAEHMAVRTVAGLFDVSHMGEIEVRGPQAINLVEHVASNYASRLEDGQAQYSALLYPHGGFVDDIVLHRIGGDHYLLCVNAANQEKDYEWIISQNRFEAQVELASDRYAQLAIQGPKAQAALAKLTDTDLSSIAYYRFAHGAVAGGPAIIARTGYTGEDGFEIYIAPEASEATWQGLLEAGGEFGILPCGLGARNTLRLEAAMSLYGHEINETITPYEARLGWIVKLEKGEFVGREALIRQKRDGSTRRLVGFEMRGRGIARDGYRVFVDGADAGWVTSGSPAPFLRKNIGLAMLPAAEARLGRAIEIQIRDRRVEAELVPTPFYSRKN